MGPGRKIPPLHLVEYVKVFPGEGLTKELKREGLSPELPGEQALWW